MEAVVAQAITAKEYVEFLKQKYPNPVTFQDYNTKLLDKEDCYCVGAALYMETFQTKADFISSHYLAKAFCEQNHRFKPDHMFVATAIAAQVIRLSDEGKFNEAWDTVLDALEFEPKNHPLVPPDKTAA